MLFRKAIKSFLLTHILVERFQTEMGYARGVKAGRWSGGWKRKGSG
jgi:hypothetical protein